MQKPVVYYPKAFAGEKMKITDFIFKYETARWSIARVGICRVRIFSNSQNQIYVVLTELDENPGSSVTNTLEEILRQLLATQKIPSAAGVIDHSPSSLGLREDFSLVSTSEKGNICWQALSLSAVRKLTECAEDEFCDYKSDARVLKEISCTLNGGESVKEIVCRELPEVSERRLEILQTRRSKEELFALLESAPSERELAAFLRSDMSLLGEVYAVVGEEYICFSEFPIAGKRVDFAVFSGRSRMRVHLIEIKGAKDGLRYKDYYKGFRKTVQDCRQQLIYEKNLIDANYEACRKYVYSVLDAVKSGQRPYGAFTGPKFRLQVDPEKDVHFIYVSIAGRTVESVSDSRLRHMHDQSFGFSIQTETWDSWCEKLTRT